MILHALISHKRILLVRFEINTLFCNIHEYKFFPPSFRAMAKKREASERASRETGNERVNNKVLQYRVNNFETFWCG